MKKWEETGLYLHLSRIDQEESDTFTHLVKGLAKAAR